MVIDNYRLWFKRCCAFLAGSILVCSICFFLQLAYSRFAYQKGLEELQKNHASEAERLFSKSLDILPLPGKSSFKLYGIAHLLLQNDLQRITSAFATTNLQKVSSFHDAKLAYSTLQTAKQYYQEAFAINPYDVEALTGLARTVFGLEKLQAVLLPDSDTPYDAAAYIDKLIALRPSGIEAHYLALRYAHYKQDFQRIFSLIRSLMSIYPQTYAQLRNETYCTEEMIDAIEIGVKKAIDEKVNATEAWFVLSAVKKEQKKFDEAIQAYKNGIATEERKPSSERFLHLTELYLLAENYPEAELNTLQALKISANRDKTLEEIWNRYQSARAFSHFIECIKKAEKQQYASEFSKILQAKSYIHLEEFAQAQTLLSQIKSVKYQAEALHVLADLGRKTKDSDMVELALQRATMLDQKNSQYRYEFAQILHQEKKYILAEEEINKAIEYAPQEDPWKFSLRGVIRLSRDNFDGARQDWQHAIKLSPQTGHFYRYLASVDEKEGNKVQAIKHLRKAVQLNPENAEYQSRLHQLEH